MPDLEHDRFIGTDPAEPPATTGPGRRFLKLARIGRFVAPVLIIALCLLHGLAIWIGLGGRAGLTNGWPLWRDDHPLYFHSALVTRTFLRDSLTTAGYDPSFMAGYAKSVVFPASSTLPELVIAAFGGAHPELAYKVYVLVSAAAVPWLVAMAAGLWQLRPSAAAVAVVLVLVYIWTDFPINYAAFGMLPYFLAIPLGLAATGAFVRFLARGGAIPWLMAAGLLSMSVLVHLTAAMIVVPAALLAYVAAARRPSGLPAEVAPEDGGTRGTSEFPPGRSLTRSSHLAVWLIPLVVLAVNAFWWVPGIWLASTKGPSDFAFSHSREGVARRLAQMVSVEAPIQSILLAAGLPGLVVLIRRQPVPGWALCGFCAAGMAWGYLAGALPALDFLQPGRHSYAFFTGLALAGGAGLEELRRRLRLGPRGRDHFDRWIMAGLVLIALRMVGPPLAGSIRFRLGEEEPFLSSRPSGRLRWVVDRVRRHVEPGERLLYEEGGLDVPGVPDPFQRGRFSGLLPHWTGVEVIGGPYLHASLTTNFTQFGEGELFGQSRWDRDHFVRYARLYRPAAIVCWSPHARRFCRAHPDLIRILEDNGVLLIGRILGYGGDTVRGRAKVEAVPGRIRVRDMVPDLDGSVVLRYHSVPYLTSRPSVACEPVFLEEDPVPFIRLRPRPGTREVELKLAFPDWP
jgi:hypothetical protein